MSEILRGRLVLFAATFSEWTIANPIIRAAEMVAEIGVGSTKLKIGDGVTRYLSLPYVFGGGSGGTGDLQNVTDAGNYTTNPLLVGDFVPVTGTDTGANINDTSIGLQDNGTPEIGMERGGGPVRAGFYILDTISGYITKLITQENFSGGNVEIAIPNETGELAILNGTKEITISGTGSKVSSFLPAGFQAKIGSVSMAGAITGASDGRLFLRATAGTAIDTILCGNLSSTGREFKTPATAAGIGGDFALRGDSIAPTVSASPSSTGLAFSTISPSDNNSGVIELLTGPGLIEDPNLLFSVVFANAYDRKPNVILGYGNEKASESGLLYTMNVTASGFEVNLRSSGGGFTGLLASETYLFTYIVMR